MTAMAPRAKRKVRTGLVTSAKMMKTVTVTLTRLIRHPLYGKVLKRKKKILVHDEKKQCKVGDRVRVMETRPLSSRKRWRVIEILSGSQEKTVKSGPSS